jgi:hypothetical protein
MPALDGAIEDVVLASDGLRTRHNRRHGGAGHLRLGLVDLLSELLAPAA